MQPAEKGKQLKQLLQQVTTLREDKTRCACIQSFCKVNNQKQQLREDNIATCFSCKGNLVVKSCIGCICCFLFIPLIPQCFRMILFFVREETWIVARFTMEYPPRTQLRFLLFLFTKLALGPILLMMINVSINDD